MNGTASFTAIIPAYNPGEIVLKVISQVIEFVDKVIVVDDGSDLDNKKLLKHCCQKSEKITLLTLSENKGKGVALFAGFKEALKSPSDYILTLDSDGQHNPKDMVKFKNYINQVPTPPDLIIGSRAQITEMPLRSRIGNVFTAFLFKFFCGGKLTDTQSGFRAFSLDFAREITEHIMPGRYETEMKILAHAVSSNRKVDDITIDTIYLDGNKNSKFRPLQDSIRVLSVFLKYVLVGLASFGVDYSIFLVATYSFGIHYLYAHTIARLCSGIFNFTCNKRLVFRSKKNVASESLRYVLTVFASFLLTSVLLYSLVDTLGIPQEFAKPISELSMFVVNFTILSTLVFPGRR